MTQTLPEILKERGERYGQFSMHAKISQQLKTVMASHDNWDLRTPQQKEALEMIMHKIARILNGHAGYRDSWMDIAGYATLVAEELKEQNEPPEMNNKHVWEKTETGWVNKTLMVKMEKGGLK